jgi:hypothetical protein
VTVLQAIAEMDAGPIWSSRTFAMPQGVSKSRLYRAEVAEAAVEAVVEAVERFEAGRFVPEPLDYRRADVTGSLRPPMRQRDRAIELLRTGPQLPRGPSTVRAQAVRAVAHQPAGAAGAAAAGPGGLSSQVWLERPGRRRAVRRRPISRRAARPTARAFGNRQDPPERPGEVCALHLRRCSLEEEAAMGRPGTHARLGVRHRRPALVSATQRSSSRGWG